MMELWQYITPAAGRTGRRMTLAARIRLWKRRRRMNDFDNLKGWK